MDRSEQGIGGRIVAQGRRFVGASGLTILAAALGGPSLGAVSPAGAAAPAPGGLEGTWALEMRVVSAASVPVVGEVRSTTITWGLLETEPEGWAQRYTVCDVEMDGQGKVIKSTLSDAFVRSLPVRRIPASLDQGRYRADLGEIHLGFDPATSQGRVPASAEDAAVVDFEGDGAPGFTVQVDVPLFPTVEVFLTQATDSALEGEQVAPGRVVGRPVVSRLEQHVIGASSAAFNRSPTVHPVGDAGSFELLRVPPETGCHQVRPLLARDR